MSLILAAVNDAKALDSIVGVKVSLVLGQGNPCPGCVDTVVNTRKGRARRKPIAIRRVHDHQCLACSIKNKNPGYAVVCCLITLDNIANPRFDSISYGVIYKLIIPKYIIVQSIKSDTRHECVKCMVEDFVGYDGVVIAIYP